MLYKGNSVENIEDIIRIENLINPNSLRMLPEIGSNGEINIVKFEDGLILRTAYNNPELSNIATQNRYSFKSIELKPITKKDINLQMGTVTVYAKNSEDNLALQIYAY